MKQLTFILTSLFIYVISFAQEGKFYFSPKWKAGDKKAINIEQAEYEYKNGKLKESDTSYMNAELTVMKEDAGVYTLQLLYENVALKAAIRFYDRLGEELHGYQNLKLVYSVNKKSGKADLQNWKEAKAFMDESFRQISAVINKKAPDASQYIQMIFAPLKNLFKNKQNIESMMNDQLGYLLFPYGKDFVAGDTLTIKSTGANPFVPSDSITQTTTAAISSISAEKKTCDIDVAETFDLSKFKQLMKTMMEQMSEGAGAKGDAKKKAAGEIDSLDFDIQNKSVIHFDYGSTWVTSISKTAVVTASEPGGKKTEKHMQVTVTVK